VHGADRTQIHATLKQAVKDLYGWLIMMLIVGQNLLNLSALLRGKCAGLASDATLSPQGIDRSTKLSSGTCCTPTVAAQIEHFTSLSLRHPWGPWHVQQ
jgi:hypothetical protein